MSKRLMAAGRFLQVPLVVTLFAVLVWRVDLGAVRTALRHADLAYVGAVVALNVPFVALFALRSHMALRSLGYRLSPRVLAPITVLGNVAGAMTPASSGELLRAGALTSRGVPAEDAAGLVVFERGLSLFYMTVGTVAVGAFFVLPAAPAAAVLGVMLCVALLPVAAPLLPERAPRERHAGTLRRAIERVIVSLDRGAAIARDRRTLSTWTLITIGIYAINTLQFWLLAESVRSVISPQEAWLALGASQLAGILSMLPFGIGASDWTLAALLRRFGMTLEQGTAVALLFRAAITLPLLAMAFASYLMLAGMRQGAAEPTTAPHPVGVRE